MRYIYTQGPWKEWRGYVFSYGNPTEVMDRASLELIKREAGFTPYEVTQPKETENGEEVKEASAEARILKGKECSKCHKLIPKGWFMHQKWCKG